MGIGGKNCLVCFRLKFAPTGDPYYIASELSIIVSRYLLKLSKELILIYGPHGKLDIRGMRLK